MDRRVGLGAACRRMLGVRRAMPLALVALAAAGALAGSCSGGTDAGDDPRAVREAVRELQRAFARRDWRGVCARLTRSARRQVGTIAHGDPGACVEDFDEAFVLIEGGGGIVDGADVTLGRVELDGGRATVAVALDDWQHAVPLAHEDGTWRIDSFFGSAPVDAERKAATMLETPFPPVAGRPAEGLDDRGEPCFGFFEDDYPDVSGSCELSASGERVSVSVMTPLGRFRFADCEVSYHAWLDDRGRTWTDSLYVTAPRNNGCSDIRQCRDPSGETTPWKGRISSAPDGGFVHRMRACLRTCIGYYVGDIELRMRPAGRGGWRARAANAAVGGSGMRFDGKLEIGDGFGVRPAGA